MGQYKTSPNHVKTKTGEIFRFATPEETPAMMSDLLEWFRKKSENNDANPFLIAAEFHYRFIRIHPFDDGNGRTARILMNFVLLRSGYPPVVIKTEDKQKYLSVLQQADSGELKPLVDFISENTIASLELMIKGAKGESVEEPDDIDKEITLLEQKIKDLSKPITVIKTKSSLQAINDKAIQPLLEFFLHQCSKLEKFYLNTKLYLQINSSSAEKVEKDQIKLFLSEVLSVKIKEIAIEYSYESLNRRGFEDANHRSIVRISFHKTHYLFANSDESIRINKTYDKAISQSEIDKLVRSEIKMHLEKLNGHMKSIDI